MNVFITGHCEGIGKAIYDQLSTNCTVTGFSLSNNYNIADTDSIISQLHGDHVFVNNAFLDFHQVELFDKWYATFKNTQSTIVNMSSAAATGSLSQALNPVYMASKKELVKHSNTAVNDLTRQCRIINISPGWVDTKFARESRGLETPMLTTNECADAVCWAISLPHHIEISSLSIRIISDK